jgi:deoxyribonuclease V
MLRGKFSVEKARRLQLRLATRVIREDKLPGTIRYVAGVDVSYCEEWAFGAVSLHDYDSLTLTEARKARVKTTLPYIPTLLSFRELKPSLAAIKKLKQRPDVYMVDAQGIAHPYRLGFASHLGIFLDKPTIGVAKSLLCGQVQPKNKAGWSPIINKDEIIGAELESKSGKPIYVSIGHKVTLDRAIEIVEHCTRISRLPEPIRSAHSLAAEAKERHKQEITHQS